MVDLRSYGCGVLHVQTGVYVGGGGQKCVGVWRAACLAPVLCPCPLLPPFPHPTPPSPILLWVCGSQHYREFFCSLVFATLALILAPDLGCYLVT